MLLAYNINRELTTAHEDGLIFFCPTCGNQVIRCNGKVNIPHFRHQHASGCRNTDGVNDPHNWKKYWQKCFGEANSDIWISNDEYKVRADILINNTVILLYQGGKSYGNLLEKLNLLHGMNMKVVLLIDGLDKGITEQISEFGNHYYKWSNAYKISYSHLLDVPVYIDTVYGLIQIDKIYNPRDLKAFTGKINTRYKFVEKMFLESWQDFKEAYPELLKTESYKVLDNDTHREDYTVLDSISYKRAKRRRKDYQPPTLFDKLKQISDNNARR